LDIRLWFIQSRYRLKDFVFEPNKSGSSEDLFLPIVPLPFQFCSSTNNEPGERINPMNLGIRFPLLLITILSVGVWSYSQAVAQVVEEDYPDANTVAEDAAPLSAATSTVYTWSTSTSGFAWLNATHWTGNTGHYPG